MKNQKNSQVKKQKTKGGLTLQEFSDFVDDFHKKALNENEKYQDLGQVAYKKLQELTSGSNYNFI